MVSLVMANSLSLIPLCSSKIPDQTGSFPLGLCFGSSNPGIGNTTGLNQLVKSPRTMRFQSLEVKATTGSSKDGKVRSILCPDCNGNGAIGCSQCKGTGVNSVDHFNGRFKAGSECWLCSGRKEMLCGNCNGAGFLGGFMSTKDE